MKKLIITGTFLAWMAIVSFSQSPNSTAMPESSQEDFISSSKEINAAKNSNPIVTDEINAKAIKEFTKSYKNMPDAKWFKLKDGFVVYFTIDGIKNKVFYNKKGNYEGMVRGYFEDKLPREIRHLVKSTYYDFSIYHVCEVSVDGITAYLVKIGDNASWKTIKVVDDEMEVTEEFLRYKKSAGN